MRSLLPRCVYKKHGAYYLVKQNKWTRLTKIKAGTAKLHQALSEIYTQDVASDLMPHLITNWLMNESIKHTESTQYDDAYRCREISKAFVQFRARDVRSPHVKEFLSQFEDRPRTYNAYRSLMRDLMRFAEENDYRDPMTNPVNCIRTKSIRARKRYPTDSELRRIKIGALYGKDGKRIRSGLGLCALIDMAYLTGQRIGDLLILEWSKIKDNGIEFIPSKTEGSTGAKVLIKWTPKLRNVIARLKAADRTNEKFVFCKLNGQPLTYKCASTNWKRAVKRAGIKNLHFHDLRAKAITDVDLERGITEANSMGTHSTEAQTADYVCNMVAKGVFATR